MKFFKALGKAFLYFGVYFATQVIVTIGYMIVWSTQKTMELMAAGEVVDELKLAEEMVVQVNEQAMALTFWSGVLALLIYWIRFAVRKKDFLKEVGVAPVPAKQLLPIIGGALIFNVVVSLVIGLIPWPQEWVDAYASSSASLDGSPISWLAAVVMAPVLEEVVFRGLIYTRLKKGMPAVVAAIAASLVFGVMHGTIIWVIYATVLGLVMTWIFEKYQSLLANIVFHLAFNAAGLLMASLT